MAKKPATACDESPGAVAVKAALSRLSEELRGEEVARVNRSARTRIDAVAVGEQAPIVLPAHSFGMFVTQTGPRVWFGCRDRPRSIRREGPCERFC